MMEGSDDFPRERGRFIHPWISAARFCCDFVTRLFKDKPYVQCNASMN